MVKAVVLGASVPVRVTSHVACVVVVVTHFSLKIAHALSSAPRMRNTITAPRMKNTITLLLLPIEIPLEWYQNDRQNLLFLIVKLTVPVEAV